MNSVARTSKVQGRAVLFPSSDELAALRAWYAGLSSRQATEHYLGQHKASGQSARAMISAIRRRLVQFAQARQRHELVGVLAHPAAERLQRSKKVLATIESLRHAPMPTPQVVDHVSAWLPVRISSALRGHGICTLADLTVRVPRRRRWWTGIAGLGMVGAAQVEAFFAQHPGLTERARALVPVRHSDTTPWEHLVLPAEMDGSRGTYRSPQATCVLDADNDYAAVQAWLSLQDSSATQRAYRKEAERLMLWAILERRRALSSLSTEDAIAYRQFLRRPTPRQRWVGPARPRSSSEWKPFQDVLSPRSVAYALSVIGALYRWLIEKRYMLANPFAGVKVKGTRPANVLASSRSFSAHEWPLVRSVADGIEWTDSGWSKEGAQRLRFALDFWYATGLRPHELVASRLGHLRRDDHGDDWLHVIGKGAKEGDVAIPLSALAALEFHLVERGLPVTRSRWDPATPLVPSLDEDGSGITSARLRVILQRFFVHTAERLEVSNPGTAERLRRATPHWLRHTHATHALANGAKLTTVRDNLRHASIATTSAYLHTEEGERARQMRHAFPLRPQVRVRQG